MNINNALKFNYRKSVKKYNLFNKIKIYNYLLI